MGRAQFLILTLLSVHVLLGAICIAASRGERDSPALRWWGWGVFVYAAGLALTLMRFLPAPLAGFAGNSLISVSAALTIHGALHYTDRRLARSAVAGGLAVAIAVLAIGNFATAAPHAAVNIVAPTVVATAFFAWGAAMLVLRPVRDAARPARFVALVLATAIAVWWARIAAMPSLLAEPIDRERLDAVVAAFAIAQILVGVGAAFGLFWIEVRLVQAAMTRMAYSDSLTGLANRRALVARFEEEVARSSRTGVGFALAILDVDRFKEVNDTHGHLVGDALLCHVGRVLEDAKRTEDVLGRLGGEEFVVLFCGHQSGGAHLAADRLRERVAGMPMIHEGSAVPVTLSGGLATHPQDGADWDRLFAAADARLYEAKRTGRNRVVGPPGPVGAPAGAAPAQAEALASD